MALSVTSLSGVVSARADEHVCDDARIHVASDVQPRWRAAIDRACAAIAALPGVDPTARVRLAAVDRDLALEVTLADGRFASRRLVSPDALLATLEALLVVPPSDARDTKDTREARVDREEPPPTITSAWPRVEEGALQRPSNEASPTIEIGGGFGGRVAARGYLSAAVAGFADIHVGSWLLGTTIRWDLIGGKSAPLVDVFEMETVVAGIVVARRMPVGFGSVDVGISPRLAVETQTFESGAAGESSLSATDVRLGSFARIAFGRSALRPIVELDADVSPSRLRRVVQLDPRLPALPSWSAGLSAGLAWTAP
ncbi:MAG: hypothetical protein JWO86_4963 [Myxococcaceae bacterium]|nr:hypothetical protein [Myxococcaceae bacterium]